jgi:choline monooxygenase
MVEELGAAITDEVTLSPPWYSDTRIYEWERRGVFGHAWQFVGLTYQLQEVGDFLTGMLAGVPIVVVRSEQGLQAHVNVCRHRGHVVAHGEGNCSSLQCHYHGWTYDLEGRLLAAPRAKREREFDLADYPLLPAKVAVWEPFVFVNLDPDAAPLEDTLGDVPAHRDAVGFDPAHYVYHSRQRVPMPCNWKLLADNMLECYHCPTGHPTFRDLYKTGVEDFHIEMLGACAYQRADPRETNEAEQAADYLGVGAQHFYNIYPNTLLIFSGDWIMGTSFTPVDATNTELTFDFAFGHDFSQRQIDGFFEWYTPLFGEDESLVRNTQIGQASGVLENGPFFTDSEFLLRQQQVLIKDALEAELDRVAKLA